MAKISCKLVRIYARQQDVKPLMRRLQALSVMDIDTAAGDEETGTCTEGFSRPDTSVKTDIYDRGLAAAEDALKILNERCPEKKGLLAAFSAPPDIAESDFYLDAAARERSRTLAGEVVNRDRKIAELNAEIVRLRTSAEQLECWKDLDLPLSFNGTAKTAAFIGTVAGQHTLETLTAALAELNPDLCPYVEIVSVGRDTTCVFLCCKAAEQTALEDALRQLSFARPTQMTSRLPREKIQSKLDRIEECRRDITACEEALKQAAERREELRFFADYCRARSDNYRTLAETECTEHAVRITGYVAEPDVGRLQQALDKLPYPVAVEVEEANEDLSPVLLKNNGFASPAETITKMYSLPSKGDIDPTPLTGFFYYLLFGMMLSDAGYGLLIVLGTVFALTKMKLTASMRQTVKMFLYCGISTVMWGLIFGSFFGDAVAVISETFFHHKVALPALLDPMHGDAVTLLIISIVIGFVQIIAGLVAKFITCMKNGDKAGAWFDTGLWITTLLGIAAIALGLAVPGPVQKIGVIVTVASLVGLVLTQGRSQKNPIMKLVSGLAALYDITGYVSDLLSFSRLMALGLTTAAMGAVFNMLGAMGGDGVFGILLMLIIFPVGHLLCFALNALGAYVHTLRLQYVELFSKFYDGGGREFKAFRYKNKYVGVTDTPTQEEN